MSFAEKHMNLAQGKIAVIANYKTMKQELYNLDIKDCYI